MFCGVIIFTVHVLPHNRWNVPLKVLKAFSVPFLHLWPCCDVIKHVFSPFRKPLRASEVSATLYFWQLLPAAPLANEKVSTVLSEHPMSLWKLRFRVQPRYSVFLARRLHTSGWSISRVINKITLARFWQASVIAANELSTSQINQSGEKGWVYAQFGKVSK